METRGQRGGEPLASIPPSTWWASPVHRKGHTQRQLRALRDWREASSVPWCRACGRRRRGQGRARAGAERDAGSSCACGRESSGDCGELRVEGQEETGQEAARACARAATGGGAELRRARLLVEELRRRGREAGRGGGRRGEERWGGGAGAAGACRPEGAATPAAAGGELEWGEGAEAEAVVRPELAGGGAPSSWESRRGAAGCKRGLRPAAAARGAEGRKRAAGDGIDGEGDRGQGRVRGFLGACVLGAARDPLANRKNGWGVERRERKEWDGDPVEARVSAGDGLWAQSGQAGRWGGRLGRPSSSASPQNTFSV